jgi:pullulanase/glycogen debranching enzyme
MMRRLIVDNVKYWMTEHHVDGFRFDLGELIDMDTMLAVRDAARAINPNAPLISEPWSFRGENKKDLKGTGWSAWNDNIRHAATDFARGKVERDWLRKGIVGSVEVWSANPIQSIAYLESHDDKTLTDSLSRRPDNNGTHLDPVEVRQNTIAATILFTSLGIPMLCEGQEFLRSKFGIHNTYNQGDKVNAVRWTDRERPLAAEALAYYEGLVALRRSEQGAAFRVRELPSNDYYRWLMPPNTKAMGYSVNLQHNHPGRAFVVLLNADEQQLVDFEISLPAGNWKQIANGREINLNGLADGASFTGPQTAHINMAPLSSVILMDGF